MEYVETHNVKLQYCSLSFQELFSDKKISFFVQYPLFPTTPRFLLKHST